jgi:hypothetical protein
MQKQDSSITLLSFGLEMRDVILEAPGRALACLGCILFLSIAFAYLRPRDYVASMVVVPLETSMTDATSQLLSSSISLRPQIALGGPPPQMAAFIKIIKSPETARFLARDGRAVAAIVDAPRGLGARLWNSSGGNEASAQNPAMRVASIQSWLEGHVTVDQDIDLMAWTINVRHPDASSALYILGQIEKSSEATIRRSAIRQYEVQEQFAMAQIEQVSDTNTKQTLYNVLSSITRALLVLRSGSDVAASTVSEPYVPLGPTYPSRFLSLAVALVALLGLTVVTVGVVAYRRARRRVVGAPLALQT